MTSKPQQFQIDLEKQDIVIFHENAQVGSCASSLERRQETSAAEDEEEIIRVVDGSYGVQQVKTTIKRWKYFIIALGIIFILLLIIAVSIDTDQIQSDLSTSSEKTIKSEVTELEKPHQIEKVENKDLTSKADKSEPQIQNKKNQKQEKIEQKDKQEHKFDVKAKIPSLNQNYLTYECTHEQFLFDFFRQEQDMLYFRTQYAVFFPICFQNWETLLGRQDIEKWHQERETIEWARSNVRRGDSVFYDCPNCRNFMDIVLLSRFVGPKGELTLGTEMSQDPCFSKIKNLHELNNVKYTSRSPKEYQSYNVVISLNEQFLRQSLNEGILDKFPQKMLTKVGANSDILNKVKETSSLTTAKVYLNSSDCRGTLGIGKADQTQGYFQVVRNDYEPKEEIESQDITEKPVLAELREEYEKFKNTLPSESTKKDLNKIVEKYQISMVKISDVSQEERSLWEKEKEVIEWMKNRTTESSVIFYELNHDNVNIWVVLNIAALVPKGLVLVFCSLDSWKRLKFQADILKLSNILLLDQKTERYFATCNLFSSDNPDTIEAITKDGKLGDKYLLGSFSDAKTDKQLLYRLYTRYQIRKVAIVPSFYFGYDIFDHFFWHSEKPEGFFQIKNQKYVIFTFWNQAIKEASEGRKYGIKEMIRVNTPQLKVINPSVLPYFILPEEPLHKSFEYLSAVHKSDYLRGYFLSHYGGGYADIKHMHFDMFPYFKKLYQSPQDMYAMGYHQKYPIYPTCVEMPGESPCSELKRNYLKMMGAGMHIHKHPSPLMDNFFKRVTNILDSKYESLKRNPAQSPRDRVGAMIQVDGRIIRSSYPIRWEEIDAECFGRAQWDNFGHTYVDMPYPITYDYK